MDSSGADIIQRLPENLASLLARLDESFRSLYGERYRGLVLYGSYARGEADEGSDVDLLLLLEGEVDTTKEIIRTEPIEWPLSLEAEYTVSLFPVEVGKYRRSEQPFLRNARREGIAFVSEIEALLEKDGRSFVAAERILKGGDADFAASRAYYGYFYVAEALLLSKGMSFSRHGQVIAQYGRHFAKSEILPSRFHRLMRRAFALRQTADYSTEPPPETDKVIELISGGEDFLREARSYLAR